MALFDYNKAGKGVEKNGPQKKPIFRFFELFARKFWKFFGLNLIYLLFCLPIVTIGPATCALVHVMRKFYLEQPIFMMSEFWTAFKKNFKQSFFLGIIDVIIILLYVFAFIFYNGALNEEYSISNLVLYAITAASSAFVLMLHFYIYPQIIALNLKMPSIIKNAVLLSVMGIKSNIITLVVILLFAMLMYLFYPYTILILPFAPAAWLAFLTVFNSYPVIQKYIINPYYETRGERNPEIPDYMLETSEGDENVSVFTDMGGKEEAVKSKSKPKTRGKVIK